MPSSIYTGTNQSGLAFISSGQITFQPLSSDSLRNDNFLIDDIEESSNIEPNGFYKIEISSNKIITLPDSSKDFEGKSVRLYRTDSNGAAVCTINSESGDFVDGGLSKTLSIGSYIELTLHTPIGWVVTNFKT
jgi:hypothetical protein